ncbi:MAG: T9SS type A sorting domain-containing protein [Bacteroidota bacterium]|nr:T9SS type A sorting domain-containing protein [Bacteroidota bacterium]
MRALLILVLLFFIETLALGQGFNKRYDCFGWNTDQTGFGIEQNAQGYVTFAVSGDYDSISPGQWFYHASVLLTHIDEQGNKIWEKRTWRPDHSAFAGWANCCDTIPGGGYIVGGSSEDTTGLDEVYLMRFNAEGDTLWTRVFGGPTDNHYWGGRQVKRTSDGGFLIVGDTGFGDIFVNGNGGFALKTDSMGNEQWRRTYGGGPPQFDSFVSCALASDGTFYLSGSQFPTEDNGGHWVLHIDASGDTIWEVLWGGPWSEGATQVATASDGHLLIFGGTGYAFNSTAMRPYIAKLDNTDGSVIWEQEYGAILYSTLFFAGKECPDGDLIAAGVSYTSQGPNVQRGLLCRTNSVGDSLWMFHYFYQDSVISTGQGRFYDVLPTADGGFIAAGSAYNPVGAALPPGYSQDTWVVKVDGNGCIIPGCNSVGIAEQATNLLDALRIWPNPVQQGEPVHISLDLPQHLNDRQLELTVVSVDEKVVHRRKLLNSSTTQPIQLPQLSSGLYHLHISSGTTWYTGGKLVVE